MKVFIYRDSDTSDTSGFYISTRKPTSNEWDEKAECYDPFTTDRAESKLPMSICSPIVRKMAREAGKRLPAKGSSDVLELELTIK